MALGEQILEREFRIHDAGSFSLEISEDLDDNLTYCLDIEMGYCSFEFGPFTKKSMLKMAAFFEEAAQIIEHVNPTDTEDNKRGADQNHNVQPNN